MAAFFRVSEATSEKNMSTGALSEAWKALRRSLVYLRGKPVGTIAALDVDDSSDKSNYD